MTTCALATPATPAQLAAAGTPLHDSLWVESTVTDAFAESWRALEAASKAPSARYGRECKTCKAAPDQPCRTLTTGRVTDTHAARIRGDR